MADFIYPDTYATPAAAIAAARAQWLVDGATHRVLLRDDAAITATLTVNFPLVLLGQTSTGEVPATATGFPADAAYPTVTGTGGSLMPLVKITDTAEVGYLRLRSEVTAGSPVVLVGSAGGGVTYEGTWLHDLDVLGCDETLAGIHCSGLFDDGGGLAADGGPDYITIENVDVHAVAGELLGATNTCGPFGIGFTALPSTDTGLGEKNRVRRVRVWDVYQSVDSHCDGDLWVDNTTGGSGLLIERHAESGYYGLFLVENSVFVGCGAAGIDDDDNPSTLTWVASSCTFVRNGRMWEQGTLGAGTAGSAKTQVRVRSESRSALLNCVSVGWGDTDDHGSVVSWSDSGGTSAAPEVKLRGVRRLDSQTQIGAAPTSVENDDVFLAAALTDATGWSLTTGDGNKVDVGPPVGSTLRTGGSTGTWQPYPGVAVTPPSTDYFGWASTGHVGAFASTAPPVTQLLLGGGWTDARFREAAPYAVPSHTGSGSTKQATPATLTDVLRQAVPGDTIVLDDGTYSTVWLHEVTGTEADPIRIAARTRHGAVFQPGTAAPGGAAFVVTDSSYVQLWGLSLIGQGHALVVGWNSGDSPGNHGPVKHLYAHHCSFQNTGFGPAVLVESGSFASDSYTRSLCTEDIRFVDCTVPSSGGAGYQLGDQPGDTGAGIGAVFDVLVRGGEITRTNGPGVDNRGAWGVVVEDVQVHDCTIGPSGHGSIVAHWWHGHPAATVGGWFVQVTRRCRVWGHTGGGANGIWIGAPNTVTESNLVWGCEKAGIVSSDLNQISGGTAKIDHNVVVGNAGGSVLLHASGDLGLVPIVNTVRNNVVDVPVMRAAPTAVTVVGVSRGTGPRPSSVSSQDGWLAPTGIRSGDVIVVMAMATGPVNDNLDLDPPAGSGWTTLVDKYEPAAAAGDVKYRPRVAAWWKTATGSESGTWLIPRGSATSDTNPAPHEAYIPYAEGSAGVGVPVGGIVVLRDVDPASLVVAAAHGDTATAPVFSVPAGVTASVDGTVALWLYGASSTLASTVAAVPSGWTEVSGGALVSTLTDPEG